MRNLSFVSPVLVKLLLQYYSLLSPKKGSNKAVMSQVRLLLLAVKSHLLLLRNFGRNK